MFDFCWEYALAKKATALDVSFVDKQRTALRAFEEKHGNARGSNSSAPAAE